MLKFTKHSVGAMTVIIASMLSFGGGGAIAQTFSDMREYEPVVMEGKQFYDWLGDVLLQDLNIYTYDSSAGFAAIPFQIDKRRNIHISYNVIGATSAVPDNCELSYWPERSTGPNGEPKTSFAETTLQPADEIVFLLRDALVGTDRAPIGAWVGGSNSTRFEVTLKDSRTQAKRYLYVFRFNGGAGTLRNPTDYIDWIPASDQSGCISGEFCAGTAVSVNLSDIETHNLSFSENWVTDSYEVQEAGGITHPNLLYRFQYTAAPNEDEHGWSQRGAAQFMGVIDDGKIRVVRGVQGALSGTRTTKYEFIYPSAMVTRVNLRVHNLNFMSVAVNHKDTVANDSRNDIGAYLWSQAGFNNNPANWVDLVDGQCLANCNGTDFQFGDWTQLNTEGHGSYVSLIDEPRPVPVPDSGSKEATYEDQANSVEVKAKYGKYKQKWKLLACTEDGLEDGPVGNLGGCADPEAPDLFFARVERFMFPWPAPVDASLGANVKADKFSSNHMDPVFATASKQTQTGGGNPCTPGTPTLGADDPGTGAVHLNLNTGSNLCTAVRLYRSSGSGSYRYLATVTAPVTYKDIGVSVGAQYNYKAVSFNEEGDESAYSSVVTITPSDTTSPPAPVIEAYHGSNSTAILDEFGVNCTHDSLGINIYMSTVSGGPYTKVNSVPLSIHEGSASWAQSGLTNGNYYYYVATMVDFSGNESAYSAEVAVLVGP